MDATIQAELNKLKHQMSSIASCADSLSKEVRDVVNSQKILENEYRLISPASKRRILKFLWKNKWWILGGTVFCVETLYIASKFFSIAI